MTKKDLLLFDLDGTLAHTIEQLAIASKKVALAMGYFVPETKEIATYVGNGANLLLVRTLCHDINATLDSVSKDTLKLAREHFNKFYLDGIKDNYVIYPHVIEGLKHFKDLNIKLAVITNKPEIFALPLLKDMGVYDLFDFVLGGEVLDKKKPDPAPLLYVLDKLGGKIENSLMVGDSINDIKAGQNCNMETVGFSYGYNQGHDIKECNPTYAFDSFLDLIKLIDSMYGK